MGSVENLLPTNFNSQLKMRYQKRRRKKRVRFFFLILIVLALAVTIFTRLPKAEIVSKEKEIKQENSLKITLDKSLLDAKGTYAVGVKNLKTGESYFLNEHQTFNTGSLYKLWIMATTFKQIHDGKLTEEEILEDTIPSLNRKFNITPEEAELTSGSISLSVKSALNQMITVSHNYAALLLTQKIKLSEVAEFLKENGFTESSIGTDGDLPKSTVADIALFYEKLYQVQLANEKYTGEMINLLKKQTLNDGLPKYLPVKTPKFSDQESTNELPIVAHKTGELGWFKHDAGIVYSEGGNYLIVVMSESDNPLGAQGRIALISKAVFDYFEEASLNTKNQ